MTASVNGDTMPRPWVRMARRVAVRAGGPAYSCSNA